MGPYVLDFYCPAQKLAVELDGGQHTFEAGRVRDDARSAYLEGFGIRVTRFSDRDVLQEPTSVLEAILDALS